MTCCVCSAMLGMGSNIFKFALNVHKYKNLTTVVGDLDFGTSQNITLKQLATQHPDFAQVLAMPFAFFFIWVYVNPNRNVAGIAVQNFMWNTQVARREYEEMYELTAYLLTAFNGTKRTFFLGNWEGDWMMATGFNIPLRLKNVNAPAGMAAWMTIRQSAIDAAKRDTPHSGVEVYFYMELNSVPEGIQDPQSQVMVNSVLPLVPVDFVSFSSYQALGWRASAVTTGLLRDCLNYIESRMPMKPLSNGLNPGVPAPYTKRVFIGEYGFPSGPSGYFTPQEAMARSALTVQTAMAWGAPFALVWEMYNSEMKPVAGVPQHRGWWLINDKEEEMPLYTLHKSLYAQGQQWVAAFRARNNRMPSLTEFQTQARLWISSLAAGLRG
ncbi:hypothetical protein QJQ45_025952 [Haematococcus lacustris]|nr:hypothetical protein QJQ45_025952 [Haematococcus lacustris]